MKRIHFLCLISFIGLLTSGIYCLGLKGGFYFDDYGQIVLNPAIELKSFDSPSLLRAAKGSNSGPLGRPISMITFALDRYFFGLNPLPYKIVNILIHLVNTILLAWLLNIILDTTAACSTDRRHTVIVMSSAWWTLHPLCVTSVLYVVQRMTSLSSMFTLLGLCLYSSFRIANNPIKFGSLIALYLLSVCTVFATLCKEIGLLTPVYAGLIELFFFRFKAASLFERRTLLTVFIGGSIVILAYVSFFLLNNPDWASNAYANRPFNLEQRFMTEARILWFYLRLLIAPAPSLMGIYHDDIELSTDLIHPATTIISIVGHALILATGILTWRRLPILAFGIFWFYTGHMLESTAWPLELTFEHRNYLAIAGPIFSISYYIFSATVNLLNGWPAKAFAMMLIVTATIGTATRVVDMGDVVSYPIIDATHHPRSSRANYDAGSSLVGLIRGDNRLLLQYSEMAQTFLETSAKVDSQAVAPYVPLIRLATLRGEALSEEHYTAFESRLRYGTSPAAIHFIARSMLEALSDEGSKMTAQRGCQLFEAALQNPRLEGTPRAHVRTAYALYLANILARRQDGISQLRKAIHDSPGGVEFRVVLAAMLIDNGLLNEPHDLLLQARALDKYGYLEDDIEHLLERISAGSTDIGPNLGVK